MTQAILRTIIPVGTRVAQKLHPRQPLRQTPQLINSQLVKEDIPKRHFLKSARLLKYSAGNPGKHQGFHGGSLHALLDRLSKGDLSIGTVGSISTPLEWQDPMPQRLDGQNVVEDLGIEQPLQKMSNRLRPFSP